MWGTDFSSGDLMLLSGIIDNSVERIKSARLLDTLLHEQQELYRTRGIFEQFLAPDAMKEKLNLEKKLLTLIEHANYQPLKPKAIAKK